MQRQAKYDNARFILVALVVLGHTIEPSILTSQALRAIYVWIYLLHLPAFSLIAGYFSKAELDPVSLRRNVLRTVVPYVVFQILYAVCIYRLEGSFRLDLLTPYWILWFLLSLLVWRLVLPAFIKLPLPLFASVMLAVAAGYSDSVGYSYNLSRTVFFFPYFLAGHLLASGTLLSRLSAAGRWWPLGVFAATAALTWMAAPYVDPKWLWGASSYGALGAEQWSAGVFRMALFGLSGVLVISFIAIVPERRGVFTSYGARSLYVYLLHGFIVLWLRHTNWISDATVAVHVALALAITLALASPLAKRSTRLLVEPLG